MPCLIDLKKMTEDDINKFKKDFKLLAEYMVKGSNHNAGSIELNHPEEVSELLLRLTGEELPIPEYNDEGGKTMEKFFEPMFERAAERIVKLISLLISDGKDDTVKEVLKDEKLRNKLCEEYGIE